LQSTEDLGWIFLGFHCGEGFQAFWISRPIAPAFLNGRYLRFSDLVQPFVAPLLQTSALAHPTLDQTCIITHITCHRYHFCPGPVARRNRPFPYRHCPAGLPTLVHWSRGCANCIVTATCILIPPHLALASRSSSYLSRSTTLSSSQRGPFLLFVEGDKTYICTFTYYTECRQRQDARG
jgi:hypothetical protein